MVHVPAKFRENTSSYSAKTKCDGQTGRQDRRTDGGRCNISRPRAYGAAGDNKATRSPEISRQQVEFSIYIYSTPYPHYPMPSYIYPYLALSTLTKHERRFVLFALPPPPQHNFPPKNLEISNVKKT